MKIRISALLLLIFCSIGVIGQEKEEPVESKGDTTEINFKKSKIIIINLDTISESAEIDGKDDDDDEKGKYYKHWSGLNIGVNMLVNDQMSIARPAGAPFLEMNHARSINFQFNLFEKSFPIIQNHLLLSTGLGLDANTYAFRSNSTLVPGTDSLQAVASPASLERNNLNLGGVRIPLLLGINTHKDPEKGLHLTAGVVGGYTYAVNLEQKYFLNGEKHVTRTRNDFNINRWTLNAIAGVGIGDWAYLYSEYQLNAFFDNNRDPQVVPFTVGIRLFDLD